MLVKRAYVHVPVIIHDVRNAGRGQNVEREILALAARHFGVAVDPAGAYAARDVRNESPVWLNKVVSKPHVESEVVILDSFENRLCNRADIELMIATQPAVASNHSPTDPFRQKQRTDLIIRGRINRAKQVASLECEFDSVRIEFVAGSNAHLCFITGEHLRVDRESDTTNTDAERFHSARLRYWSVIVLQLSVAAFVSAKTQGGAISSTICG